MTGKHLLPWIYAGCNILPENMNKQRYTAMSVPDVYTLQALQIRGSERSRQMPVKKGLRFLLKVFSVLTTAIH